MFPYTFRNLISSLILYFLLFFPHLAMAGGIVLGGTRVVYPADAKQVTLSVRNSSKEISYLVQSWAENEKGDKSTHFIITPPLYVSHPGDQNMLRVMFSGPDLPQDRETLYFFNAKAIPSVDKTKLENKNTLLLAAVTRIKMFVRPQGLPVSVEKAPSMLAFTRHGSKVKITNPSPYHVTLVQLKLDGRKVTDTMVAPFSTQFLTGSGTPQTLTYSTINDYGAVSAPQRQSL